MQHGLRIYWPLTMRTGMRFCARPCEPARNRRQPARILPPALGRVNAVRVAHPLARALHAGGISRHADGDGAALTTICHEFKEWTRASERFSVSPGRERGYFHMPAPERHPCAVLSRGFDAWATGSPTPFLPGRKRTN